MSARQRIYRRGGGKLGVDTGARLQFKFAHRLRYWWKFYNAARFELWRVDSEGRRSRLVRTGPKVSYCLRDPRTPARLAGSPRSFIYPSCSTFRRASGSPWVRRWAGPHLPAHLPRAVDRRDRPARVLRLRPHRGPRERDLRAQRGQQRGSGDRAAALSCTGAPKGLPRQRSRSLVRPRSVLVARCGSGAPRAFVCAARVAGCRGRASVRQQPGSGDLPVARRHCCRCAVAQPRRADQSGRRVGHCPAATVSGAVNPGQWRAQPRFSSVTKPTTRPVHPWLLSLEDAGACHTAARAAVAR